MLPAQPLPGSGAVLLACCRVTQHLCTQLQHHARSLHVQQVSSAASAKLSVAPVEAPCPTEPRPAATATAAQTSHNPLMGAIEHLLAEQKHAGPSNTAAAVRVWLVPGSAPRPAESLNTALLQAQQTSGQYSMEPSISYAASNCYDRTDIKMESQVIFDSCWRRFMEKHQVNELRVPREIIWLNGAPGSGKGVNTPHILTARGISQAICLSQALLAFPEARKYIDAGEMISDSVVGDVLLQELLSPFVGEPGKEFGVLVDGFPRTALQVDFVKLLMDRLRYLHHAHLGTPLCPQFPRPSFKMVVLYVDEETSVARQQQRVVAAQAHNRRVRDAGVDPEHLKEERATDLSGEKARKRYQIFRQHYSAILRLKSFFPFHLVDAMGSLADTQKQIAQELRYQSSLDLNEETYAAIRHLPLAADLQRTARLQLVTRLEGYCLRQRGLFGQVLALVGEELVPLLEQGALAGHAEWVTRDTLFEQHPVAVNMMLDVLSDRGFQASCVREQAAVAERFDPVTGRVSSAWVTLHRFLLRFEAPIVRQANTLKAMEIAARVAEAARSGAAHAVNSAVGAVGAGGSIGFSDAGLHAPSPITDTYIPQHLDLERRLAEAEAAHKAGRCSQQQAALCSGITPPHSCSRPDDSGCSDGEAGEVPTAATA